MNNQPLETNIALKKGKNLAPLEPLLELRDRRRNSPSHYLTDAIRERYNHYANLDKETWRDLIQVGHLTCLFIQGKQNLKFNKFTNTYYAVPLDQTQNEKYRVTPITRFYATNSESRYMSSNPKVNVLPGREDDQCDEAARGAKTIVEHYQKKLYTNWAHREDVNLLLGFGTNMHQTRWDSSIDGWKAVKRIFEEREIPISRGVGQCFDCGMASDGTQFFAESEQFPSCPSCKTNNVYAEPPAMQLMSVETGQKQINLGDITRKALEFPAVRFDLRVKPEESSWFIYDQIITLGAVRRLFGDVEIPEDSALDDFGLKVIESLAKAGIAVNGKTNVSDEQVKSALYRERTKLTEFYLSAEDLTGMKSRGNEKTVSGETIPAGKDYSEIYPNGATFVGLSGMKIILGVYQDAAHKKELTSKVWHMRQFSGAGQGYSDMVEINKRYNETDSQGYEGLKHSSTPATFYRQGAIDKQYFDYIGRPDVVIPINFDDSDIRSINDVIASPRVGNVDTAMISYYASNLQNMMQLVSGVTNFSGGLPGVNNKTATGAQISEANASALFDPMISGKVDVYVREAEIFVDLYRENVPTEQFFPLKSKYGASQGVYLSGADLDKDLLFVVVKNSEQPKTRLTVRDDIDRFMLMAGGLAGALQVQQTSPQFFSELTTKYDVEFELNDFDEIASICRARFEEAKKLKQKFEQIEQFVSTMASQLSAQMPQMNSDYLAEEIPYDDSQDGAMMPQQNSQQLQPSPMAQMPQMNQQMPMNQQMMMSPMSPERMKAVEIVQSLNSKISLYEPNHMEKAEWFSNFLDTNESRRLDPLTREIVFVLIETHFTAGRDRASVMAAMQGQVQLAGQLPSQMASMMQNQVSARQEHERGEVSADNDAARQKLLAENNPTNAQ